MNPVDFIKKPKENIMSKDQSSMLFFKDPENKNKNHVSHVEIGVPDPIEELQKLQNRPEPCTVLAVITTLVILVLLIFALGALGLHDISAFKWEPKPQKALRIMLDLPCQTKECVKYSAELEKPDHRKAVNVVRRMLSKCAMGKTEEIHQVGRLSSIILPGLPFPLLNNSWTKPSDPISTSNSSTTYSYPFLTKILAHIILHNPDDAGFVGIKPSSDSEFSLFVVKPFSPVLTNFKFRNMYDILKRNAPESSTNGMIDLEFDRQRQLNDVIKLQTKLEKIEFKADPEVVNLTEIQRQMPIIDWKRLIDSWIPNGYAHLKEKVYGFNTSYYEEINAIISSTPSETIYNFLFLRFSFKFLRTEVASDLEDTCLHQLSTTIPGKIVLYGSEEPEALNLLNGMLHTIKDQLKRSLATLKWMDSRGIEEAQKKFNKTKTVFGFTGEDLIDELVGKITPESNYISTLQNVLLWQTRNMFKSVAENNVTVFLNSEVFYSVEKNEITISRALLHYPFMSANLPNYTNFATIASKILPQMIHIFDERGRFYDSDGNHRNWWNTETERYFQIIVQCFDGMMQNVFGVSVSIGWNAYDSTKEPYATLPGIQQSSDEALFFYSMVKTMCTSDPDNVNEALASVPQFNSAFKCNNGTKMNPPTKCKLAS
eukprot:NP_495044.2 NEPrilysin metallopeptidase family [Caenorhabditis elegans]